MRSLISLLAFVFGIHCFSQQQPYIERIDGTKTPVSNVRIDGLHKKVIYRISGEGKDVKAGFSKLKSVSFQDYRFRIYKIGKKVEGFYILSETPTKTLGFREFARTFAHGGFESYVRHVDVAVFDSQNNLLGRFDLREKDSEKSLAEKQKTLEAIRKNFLDCPKLLEKLNENYKPGDKKKVAMLPVFDWPVHTIECN